MAEPVAVQCSSACTVTLQLTLSEASGSPFVMSVADGALLSGAIISVWVSALIFRSFIRTVLGRNNDE